MRKLGRITAITLLGALAMTATGDVTLDRDYSFTLATGVFSGSGDWTFDIDGTAAALSVDYDDKGKLIGTATLGVTDFPVKGTLKNGRKGLALKFVSTDRSIAKFTLKGIANGADGTCTGTVTGNVTAEGALFKKTAFTGMLPAGSTDQMSVSLSLSQDDRGKLFGTGSVTTPAGRTYGNLTAKGKTKSTKKGQKVTVTLKGTTGKVFSFKGALTDFALAGKAVSTVPGFKATKLPTGFNVVDFGLILDGDYGQPFTTDSGSLPLGGSVVDVDGVGYPAAIQWSNGVDTGTLPVDADGLFTGSLMLQPGANQVQLGLPGAPPILTIFPTFNEGFTFGGRLELDPDIAYVGESRDITARIALPGQNVDAGTIFLVNTATGAQLTELVDTGNLNFGDEIEGDGVFSGIFTVFEVSQMTLPLRVDLTHSGGTTALSEVFALEVTQPLTAQDVADIEAIQDPHQATLDALSDPAAIQAAVQTILDDVVAQPGVSAAGPSGDGLGLWILYDSGILGVVYAPAADVKSGRSRNRRAAQPAAREDDALPPEPGRRPYLGHYGLRSEGRTAGKAAEKDLIKSSKVRSIAAQYFDWGENDDIPVMTQKLEDAGCYDVLYTKYTSKGSGSVEDFKGLGGYGIVLISSHGDSFFAGIPGLIKQKFGWNGPFGEVVIHTNAAFNATSAATYADDAKKGRLVKWGSNIGFLPAFITRYSGAMPNTLVYSSVCRGTWDSSMALAFLGRGAGAYLGYSDYVAVSFCKTNGTALIDKLLMPDGSLATAFTPGIKETDSDPAEFRLYGNKMLSIENKGLKDAGFESGQIRQAWTVAGDGRVIAQLGAAGPTEGGLMGIISTGLGFTTASGSLTQVFCAPANAESIAFDWNYFSEEFPEFVGSQFQDTFEVTIENAKDGTNRTTLLFETVDSLAGSVADVAISFDQGGVQATGWLTETVPFPAALKGQPVRLVFNCFDVGDSIYDTAVLIDDIVIAETP